MNDRVNHPKHYTSHPSGIECIQVTEHYNFTIGNAIKYLWRQGLKDEANIEPASKQIEDCEKAIWYIQREIKNLKEGVYDGENKQKQNEVVAQGSSKNQRAGGQKAHGSSDESGFRYAYSTTPTTTITFNAGSDLSCFAGEESCYPWNCGAGTFSTNYGTDTITITDCGADFTQHGGTVTLGPIEANVAQYPYQSEFKFDNMNNTNYYTMNGGTVWTGAPSLWNVIMKEHINEVK